METPKKTSTIQRLPPQNNEAEQCVLGSILLHPSAVLKAVETLVPDDFEALFRIVLVEFRVQSRVHSSDLCGDTPDFYSGDLPPCFRITSSRVRPSSYFQDVQPFELWANTISEAALGDEKT